MTKEKSVTLIENFVSWQGEGPDSGRTMIILRFKTCNLRCSWCDTQVKMRISNEAPYKISDIQDQINNRAAGILITGGEPTVPKHFDETLILLHDLAYPIANIETNGYNLEGLLKAMPDKSSGKDIKIMYSPKIFSHEDATTALDKLENIPENVYVKFVYEPDNKHLITVFEYITKHMPWLVMAQRIWLMPEGHTRADLLRNSGPVFDACEEYNFCFSSRSHLIFDFI